mgnify:CR=1 FL=1
MPTIPNMATEDEKVVPLTGMPGNPGREPKVKDKSQRGSVGDKAFMDGVYIVVAAWVLILALAYSLRHHNV